jgi:hypothetical protein
MLEPHALVLRNIPADPPRDPINRPNGFYP